LDLDPTNNVCPGNEHITTAWGSDYADVAPIGGLLIGGGTTTLKVGVDVSPIPVKEEEK
jgi:transglutaminase-like putative cysteine protease